MKNNAIYQEDILDIIETHDSSMYAERPLDLEWANDMHAGQDAKFLLRRRSLLLDLWHFMKPDLMHASKNLIENQGSHKSVKQWFLGSVQKEIKELNFTPSPLHEQSPKWDLECFAVVQ